MARVNLSLTFTKTFMNTTTNRKTDSDIDLKYTLMSIQNKIEADLDKIKCLIANLDVIDSIYYEEQTGSLVANCINKRAHEYLKTKKVIEDDTYDFSDEETNSDRYHMIDNIVTSHGYNIDNIFSINDD